MALNRTKASLSGTGKTSSAGEMIESLATDNLSGQGITHALEPRHANPPCDFLAVRS